MNTITQVTKNQPLVWMLDLSGELVNEVRTGKRDGDGRFLKQHVKLEVTAKVHSDSDEELAAKFGYSASDLFA